MLANPHPVPRVESPRNRESFIELISQESCTSMRKGKNKKLMKVNKIEVRIVVTFGWAGIDREGTPETTQMIGMFNILNGMVVIWVCTHF